MGGTPVLLSLVPTVHGRGPTRCAELSQACTEIMWTGGQPGTARTWRTNGATLYTTRQIKLRAGFAICSTATLIANNYSCMLVGNAFIHAAWYAGVFPWFVLRDLIDSACILFVYSVSLFLPLLCFCFLFVILCSASHHGLQCSCSFAYLYLATFLHPVLRNGFIPALLICKCRYVAIYSNRSDLATSQLLHINYSPSSRKQACKLITQHVAGWRWSGASGVGCKSLLNFFAQCNAYSSLPGNNHCPLPLTSTVLCLGTFAVPAWDACQFPAWERLPVCMPLPGHACSPCLGHLPVPCLWKFASALCLSLPGTLASPLPGNAFCWDAVPSWALSYAYRSSMRRELLRLLKPDMPRTPVPWWTSSEEDAKPRKKNQ